MFGNVECYVFIGKFTTTFKFYAFLALWSKDFIGSNVVHCGVIVP